MANRINVNLDTNKNIYDIFECKQNDDLILEANIFENGLGLNITNKEVTINCNRADGTFVIQNTEITKENNKIIANLKRDFTRVGGLDKLEIVLTENGKQNTTFDFNILVKNSVISGAVESTNTATILEELGKKIVQAGQVKAETEALIQNGGAATKGDIANVNSQLEQIEQQKAEKIVTTNLQGQINSLVLGAVGNGNNAEIIQSRTDVIGNLFPTLKSNLDNINKMITDGNTEIVLLDWEKGNIDSTGNIVSSAAYIRTNGFHNINIGDKIKIIGNVLTKLIWYDDSEVFKKVDVIELGQTREFVAESQKYKIVVNQTALTVMPFIYKNIEMKKIKEAENKILKGYESYTISSWEKGNINTVGENTSMNSRLRTVNKSNFEIGKKLKIEIAEGYKVGMYWYDSEGIFKDYFVWYTEDVEVVAKHPEFRVLIANDSIETATNDFLNYVKFFEEVTLDEIKKARVDINGNVFNTLDERLNSIESGITYSNVYFGEKLDFKKYKFDYEEIFEMLGTDNPNLNSPSSSQSICIYKNYIFQFFNGNQAKVYNISNKSYIGTIEIKSEHGNTSQFSNEFYATSDEFPLLYVSSLTTPCEIYINRVTTTTSTLIKTLVFPQSAGYSANTCIDFDNNIIYVIGYSRSDYYTPATTIWSKFDMSELTLNENGTYSPKLIETVETPFWGIMQDMKCFRGDVYLLSNNGFKNKDKACIFRIDTASRAIRTEIPMLFKYYGECEGIEFIEEDSQFHLMVGARSSYVNNKLFKLKI